MAFYTLKKDIEAERFWPWRRNEPFFADVVADFLGSLSKGGPGTEVKFRLGAASVSPGDYIVRLPNGIMRAVPQDVFQALCHCEG